MSQPQNSWQAKYGEYVSGALFGLITLDLFMLLIHGMLERAIADYSMGTLGITIPIALVWCFQKLYAQQSEATH